MGWICDFKESLKKWTTSTAWESTSCGWTFSESPPVDNGYDVANYRAIHPRYGSMADFDAMLAGFSCARHQVCLDVVNHSSNQHEWFKQAWSSARQPLLPLTTAGGRLKKASNALPSQPFRPEGLIRCGKAWTPITCTVCRENSLTWTGKPQSYDKVKRHLKFWAEKGVDGFRMDAFQFASKDTTWPNSQRPWKGVYQMVRHAPPIARVPKRKWTKKCFPSSRVCRGRGCGSTFQDAHDLVDAGSLNCKWSPFWVGRFILNSRGLHLSGIQGGVQPLGQCLCQRAGLPFPPTTTTPASWTALGIRSAAFRRLHPKCFWTPFAEHARYAHTYYGEIGMTNIDMPNIEDYVDVDAKAQIPGRRNSGAIWMPSWKCSITAPEKTAGRPCTMGGTANAGFTTNPWKRVTWKFTREINVALQTKTWTAFWTISGRPRARKANPVLVYGDYKDCFRKSTGIYAYTRTLGTKRCWCCWILAVKRRPSAYRDLRKIWEYVDQQLSGTGDWRLWGTADALPSGSSWRWSPSGLGNDHCPSVEIKRQEPWY